MTDRVHRTATATVALLALPLLLAACESPPGLSSFDENFGNAYYHNIAVQTVNPEPANAKVPPEHSGARTAIAVGRYEADKVKQPPRLQTSDIKVISADSISTSR